MEHHTLGNSGLKVSRLALGTMTFGDEWGWGAPEKDARAIFDAYLEAGGNLIDTADLYTNGSSETMLGKFVRDSGARDRVVVATKFSFCAEGGNPNAGGNGRKNVMRAVEGSLRRLGLGHIDLYLLHAWDRFTPAEEVMRTLDDLVSSGKVRHVGLSNVPAWYAARAQGIAEMRGHEPVCALQLEYSLAERGVEHEFVPMCARLGMGIMAWSPLAGGLLCGKYSVSKGKVEGEGRVKTTAGSGNPALEKATPRNLRIAAEVTRVAARIGRTPAQVALNWVANRPGVAAALVGATKLSQLRDNLRALEFEIPARMAARLERASDPGMPYPYYFFGGAMQAMVSGGTVVDEKPPGYWPGRAPRGPAPPGPAGE